MNHVSKMVLVPFEKYKRIQEQKDTNKNHTCDNYSQTEPVIESEKKSQNCEEENQTGSGEILPPPGIPISKRIRRQKPVKRLHWIKLK